MMIQSFLGELSTRFYKENNLSDITFCLCNASPHFQKSFLKFFFPDIVLSDIISFKRELLNDDSRPDFYIETSKEIYLIEVKIYDTNHHFEQYCNTFSIPPSRLGYITNYNMRKDGYKVKTWTEFYEYLYNIVEKESCDNQKLIYGYLSYIQSVCSIIRIKNPMKLESLHTFYIFNQLLKKSINRDTERYELSFYQRQLKENRTGHYFKIEDKQKAKEDLWLWIGSYYDQENPIIYIEVLNSEGCGKLLYDFIDQNKDLFSQQILSKRPYKNANAYFFDSSSSFNQSFNTATTIEEQVALLTQFTDEILVPYFQ